MSDREPPEPGHIPTSVKKNHEEYRKLKAERREAEARAELAESVAVADLEVCEEHGLFYDGRYTDKCAQCQMSEFIEATRTK